MSRRRYRMGRSTAPVMLGEDWNWSYAMSKKFIELASNDRGHIRENDWLGYCQRHRLPFVTVRRRGNVADVHWDYINFPPNIDSDIFRAESNIRDAVGRIYDACRTGKSTARVCSGTVALYDLGIPEARRAAALLYDAIEHNVSRCLHDARCLMDGQPVLMKKILM